MDASMRAWIGLGANVGDGAGAIARALACIAALPDVDVQRVSSLYRSAPVDAGGPDFTNAAARVETTRTPQALLDELLAIEAKLGRVRSHRNAPRTIDLDLLLACDERGAIVVDTPTLTLPHPRLASRAFALAPLAELDPALQVPGIGPVGTLLDACTGQRIERIGAMPR